MGFGGFWRVLEEFRLVWEGLGGFRNVLEGLGGFLMG